MWQSANIALIRRKLRSCGLKVAVWVRAAVTFLGFAPTILVLLASPPEFSGESRLVAIIISSPSLKNNISIFSNGQIESLISGSSFPLIITLLSILPKRPVSITRGNEILVITQL